MCVATGIERTPQAGRVLVKVVDERQESLWHNRKSVSIRGLGDISVVWAVKLLDPHLQGAHLTIRTDQEALSWILDMTDAKGRLSRWRLRLSVLEYDIVHRAGVKHQAADE